MQSDWKTVIYFYPLPKHMSIIAKCEKFVKFVLISGKTPFRIE